MTKKEYNGTLALSCLLALTCFEFAQWFQNYINQASLVWNSILMNVYLTTLFDSASLISYILIVIACFKPLPALTYVVCAITFLCPILSIVAPSSIFDSASYQNIPEFFRISGLAAAVSFILCMAFGIFFHGKKMKAFVIIAISSSVVLTLLLFLFVSALHYGYIGPALVYAKYPIMTMLPMLLFNNKHWNSPEQSGIDKPTSEYSYLEAYKQQIKDGKKDVQ